MNRQNNNRSRWDEDRESSGYYGNRSHGANWRSNDDYRSSGNQSHNYGGSDRYGNYDNDEGNYNNRGNYSSRSNRSSFEGSQGYGRYERPDNNYQRGNDNNFDRHRDHDDRNFFERTGEKIKEKWNDWTNNDHNDRDRDNRNSFQNNRRGYGQRSYNNPSMDSYGSGGNQNSHYQMDRYQRENEGNTRGSRDWEHDRNYRSGSNYNQSRDNQERYYYGVDNDHGRADMGASRSDRSYDYYESYPNYGHSQKNGNDYRDTQRNNSRYESDYRNSDRNERRQRSTSNWSNAYTPMSEYM